jgi:hypothetical protein
MPGRRVSRNRKMSRRRFSSKRVNKSVRTKRSKRTKRTRRRMKGGAKGNEMSQKDIQASLDKLLDNDDSPSYKAWLAHMIMKLNLLAGLPQRTKERFDCKSDIYTGKSEEDCVNYMKQNVQAALRKKIVSEQPASFTALDKHAMIAKYRAQTKTDTHFGDMSHGRSTSNGLALPSPATDSSQRFFVPFKRHTQPSHITNIREGEGEVYE